MKMRFLSMVAALALAVPAVATAADGMPIEPVDLPPSIQQGVDMIYIDQELMPAGVQGDPADRLLQTASLDEALAFDPFQSVHPIYSDLRRGMMRYRMRWGSLPDIQVPAGPVLKLGAKDERVHALRARLGLPDGDAFDAALEKTVREYQQVHGLKVDGIVGNQMVASLNLGPRHYEQILLVNLERARRLPVAEEQPRYILVDSGSARIYLYENGKAVDSMRAIVGAQETATPMMAALMRYVSVNPYWNVPPELVQSLIAPNVLKEGLTYLSDRDYEVLSDWTDEAKPVDPATVDWRAIANGEETKLLLRRGPGPYNSMGKIKFMLPNDFGIYLHDYPDKAKFAVDDRWISNGCVRVEDAERLARWIFGYMPKGSDPKVEENVDLPEPIPVYMTYLTAAATSDGVQFRADPYQRDASVIARYFSEPREIVSR